MANRTPLYDWHVAHGARMVDFAGWDMPVQYTTIIEEHQAVRTARRPVRHQPHGPALLRRDRTPLALIQHVYTNNAATMKDGQVRYGLVCNDQGGIRDDVLVYRWPTAGRWSSTPPTARRSSPGSPSTRARRTVAMQRHDPDNRA